MSYTISIPDVLPSLNGMGRSWGKSHRLKKQWAKDIAALLGREALKDLRGLAEQAAKMRVTITVHNAREYDDDNKRFTEKVIYDALKNLRLLYDDRPAFVERKLEWVKCKRVEKHTVIEIGAAR
jgi:hypothetical protein